MNWLHFIWPYSSRTWESVRNANWGIGICATSLFPKISVFGTGCTLSGPTVRVPGKVSGMRTGEEEYVKPVRSQNFWFWNWLHFIWPYSSSTWGIARYANWERGICATSSFPKFLILELVALHLALQFAFLGNWISSLNEFWNSRVLELECHVGF